uniref:Uncharacterized protein n=1 Tax=Arundo donax TaxID=35708 RepID=A0A0A9CEG6_ARUDO
MLSPLSAGGHGDDDCWRRLSRGDAGTLGALSLMGSSSSWRLGGRRWRREAKEARAPTPRSPVAPHLAAATSCSPPRPMPRRGAQHGRLPRSGAMRRWHGSGATGDAGASEPQLAVRPPTSKL